MSFALLSNDFASEFKIPIDNLFIIDYLPHAPDNYVKIYLYGLSNAICDNKDNTLERISKLLQIDEKTVLEAFAYWDEKGLIRLHQGEEPTITYLSVKNAKHITKKFSKSKYAPFNKALESQIKDRIFVPNELYKFYEFMEEYDMEWDAFLFVVHYCIKLKGIKISSNYIIAVARSQADEGNLTLDSVNESLSEVKLYEKDIKQIFTALRLHRQIDHDDKNLYLKWTKIWKFDLETLTYIAKQKRTSMENLDKIIQSYYDKKLLSLKEIDNYNLQKFNLIKLTRKIVNNIGLRYENVDNIIKLYILPWYNLGFDDDALIYISNYCLKNVKKNLEDMDKVIKKFYNKGILTKSALESFVKNENKNDDKINDILNKLNVDRTILDSDRINYKTWTENWKISKDLINYAIELSIGKSAPLPYMNKILSTWAHIGINTLDKAKEYSTKEKAKFELEKNTKINKNIKNYKTEGWNDLYKDVEL